MKLNKDEKVLKEYSFSKEKETLDKALLTNRRLIFFNNDSEENYPLSKITSVKVEKEKSDFRTKVLGFAAISLIILLIVTGAMIFGESNPNWNTIFALIPIYLILIWLIRFGLKPEKVTTKLVISQLGGTKKYIAKNNKDLQEFIDKVNEILA